MCKSHFHSCKKLLLQEFNIFKCNITEIFLSTAWNTNQITSSNDLMTYKFWENTCHGRLLLLPIPTFFPVNHFYLPNITSEHALKLHKMRHNRRNSNKVGPLL